MTCRGRGRKFGEKQSFPFPVWNGLLEHRKRIGSALWEYLWCLDRITLERDGVGLVSNGAPIKAKKIASDLKVGRETVKRNLQTLADDGYIQLHRTPYGNTITVMNSLKFGIWAPHKRSDRNVASVAQRDDKKVASQTREATEVSLPEATKVSRTKKTQQTTRSKENTLYKKEGFSEFWKEYPRHEGKQEAVMAWAKIKPEDHARIMAGLKRWKQSRQWQKDGGQFILYAVRFLRRKSWKETPIDLQPTEAEQGQEREMVRARIPA